MRRRTHQRPLRPHAPAFCAARTPACVQGPTTADPAAADCADRRQKLDAALQRHALVVGDADPPTVDVAYHCALDLLVRGRAVEPPLATPPQEEPTAPAPKHLEPTRAPAAALGDATNTAVAAQ